MRKYWLVVTFLIGLLAGGIATQVIQRTRPARQDFTRKTYLLEQKIRCSKVADDYRKNNVVSSGPYRIDIDFHEVNFSEVRNSCLVSVDRTIFTGGTQTKYFLVIDLLTEQELYSSSCNDTPNAKDYCANNDLEERLKQERDRAYDLRFPTQ